MPALRSVVGTLWSATAMVASGRRTLRPAARRPSNACGLGHLEDEMAVDVEQHRAVLLLLDDDGCPRSCRTACAVRSWRFLRRGGLERDVAGPLDW